MEQSILKSVKKTLNLDASYTAFDQDVLTHINTVFAILSQIGIGPEQGFMIEDDTTEWSAYTGDDLFLNMVKSYVYLRVRLLFDPPTTSYLITAQEKQIEEMEVRMSIYRESYAWVNPNANYVEDDVLILDGGAP